MKLKPLDSIERAVLAYVMSDKTLLDQCCKSLSPDHFTGVQHKIFEEVFKLYKEGLEADIVTLNSRLSPSVPMETLMDISIETGGRLEQHIKTLKERLSRKTTINQCLKLQQELFNEDSPITDSLDSFNNTVTQAIEDGSEVEDYSHKKSVEKYLNYLEKGMIGNALKGVNSHLGDLDKVINGWQRGLTYVVGGLKKTGKSRFALDISSCLLSQGLCGIIFSMEMSENKIHDCIFANRLKINTAKFGTSSLTQDDYRSVIEECPKYMQERLFISRKSRIEPEYIKEFIRHVKRKYPVDFVIVDYIQRMKGRGESRTKEIEYCMTSIADISRDENVIMIALSQLNKDAEKKGGESPIYSHYKESQAIIEAADTIITLDDPNRGKEGMGNENYKELDAIVLQRDGVSDVWIKLHAELQYSKFNSISGREE